MDKGLARDGHSGRIWFFEKHDFCQSRFGVVKNRAFCKREGDKDAKKYWTSFGCCSDNSWMQ